MSKVTNVKVVIESDAHFKHVQEQLFALGCSWETLGTKAISGGAMGIPLQGALQGNGA